MRPGPFLGAQCATVFLEYLLRCAADDPATPARLVKATAAPPPPDEDEDDEDGDGPEPQPLAFVELPGAVDFDGSTHRFFARASYLAVLGGGVRPRRGALSATEALAPGRPVAAEGGVGGAPRAGAVGVGMR